MLSTPFSIHGLRQRPNSGTSLLPPPQRYSEYTQPTDWCHFPASWKPPSSRAFFFISSRSPKTRAPAGHAATQACTSPLPASIRSAQNVHLSTLPVGISSAYLTRSYSLSSPNSPFRSHRSNGRHRGTQKHTPCSRCTLLINNDNAVFPLRRGTRGARFNAGRVFAMVAQHRQNRFPSRLDTCPQSFARHESELPRRGSMCPLHAVAHGNRRIFSNQSAFHMP